MFVTISESLFNIFLIDTVLKLADFILNVLTFYFKK